MKKFIILFLALLLLAQPAGAVKKAIVVVGEKWASTRWVSMSVGCLLGLYGEAPDYVYANQDEDSLDAHLLNVDSDVYGCIIFPVVDGYFNHPTSGGYAPYYGAGALTDYTHLYQNKHPGVPVIIVGQNDLHRQYHDANAFFLSGVGNDGTWPDGNDSLIAETQWGDTLIWHHTTGQQKMDWDLDAGGESPYWWYADIWVQGSGPRMGQANNRPLMWHCQTSPTTTDSIIWYLPYFGDAESVGYDKMKALAAVLYRCGVLNYIPVYNGMEDYGYNMSGMDSTGLAANTADLFKWYINHEKYLNVWTQQCDADPNQFPGDMTWYSSQPFIKFGWGPDNAWPTGGKRNIFWDWGDDPGETGAALYDMMKESRDSLTTKGYDAVMDPTFFTFCRHDYSGATGERLQDTILTALAAVGVRNFKVATRYSFWYESSYQWYSIPYPYKNYPLDISWTGAGTTVNVNFFITEDMPLLGDSTSAFPQRSDPFALTPKERLDQYDNFYRYFGKQLFGNWRGKDGSSASCDPGTSGDWPWAYNCEERGVYYYSHWNACSRNDPKTNSFHLYAQLMWNNLDAYNAIAKGECFRSLPIRNMQQRPNDPFTSGATSLDYYTWACEGRYNTRIPYFATLYNWVDGPVDLTYTFQHGGDYPMVVYWAKPAHYNMEDAGCWCSLPPAAKITARPDSAAMCWDYIPYGWNDPDEPGHIIEVPCWRHFTAHNPLRSLTPCADNWHYHGYFTPKTEIWEYDAQPPGEVHPLYSGSPEYQLIYDYEENEADFWRLHEWRSWNRTMPDEDSYDPATNTIDYDRSPVQYCRTGLVPDSCGMQPSSYFWDGDSYHGQCGFGWDGTRVDTRVVKWVQGIRDNSPMLLEEKHCSGCYFAMPNFVDVGVAPFAFEPSLCDEDSMAIAMGAMWVVIGPEMPRRERTSFEIINNWPLPCDARYKLGVHKVATFCHQAYGWWNDNYPNWKAGPWYSWAYYPRGPVQQMIWQIDWFGTEQHPDKAVETITWHSWYDRNDDYVVDYADFQILWYGDNWFSGPMKFPRLAEFGLVCGKSGYEKKQFVWNWDASYEYDPEPDPEPDPRSKYDIRLK